MFVNCYDVFDACLPFGGFKNSGVGREMGQQVLNDYIEWKTVIVKRDPKSLP